MKKPPVSASGQGQYRVLKLHEGPVPLDTAEPIKRGGVEHLVRHTQCLTATIPLVIPFFLNFRKGQPSPETDHNFDASICYSKK